MTKKPRGGTRQPELFARSKRPTIPIEENHRLVLLTDQIDWTELLQLVEEIRLASVKNAAGRPPHLRALVGALLLKTTRHATLREAEDLIRHYAPARYLCGVTEAECSPDHNTLHDFEVRFRCMKPVPPEISGALSGAQMANAAECRTGSGVASERGHCCSVLCGA